jgi:hypothetical protein
VLSSIAQRLLDIELRDDPESLGYRKYIMQYLNDNSDLTPIYNLSEILHSNYKTTEYIKIPIRCFFQFLVSPSLGVIIENRQIILELINRIPQTEHSTISELNNIPAKDLLDFLTAYGPAITLHYFGCMDFTEEEASEFLIVASNILRYIIANDGLVEREYVERGNHIPRISTIFSGIVAPNSIEKSDIQESINRLHIYGSY